MNREKNLKDDMPSGYLNTEPLLEIYLATLREHPPSEFGRKTILFTFTRHPTLDRWTTRIGGLPAWPVDREWPVCQECNEPLAFVAQLDFRKIDSVGFDLLVFHCCMDCLPIGDGGSSRISLFRQSRSALMDHAIVPDSLEDDEPGPCYGVPHEILDYADEFTAYGTKIGGYRIDIQPSNPPKDSEGLDMIYLATLGGLEGSELEKIPSTPAVGDLCWGDMGCVTFWYSKIGDQEEVRWDWSCY